MKFARVFMALIVTIITVKFMICHWSGDITTMMSRDTVMGYITFPMFFTPTSITHLRPSVTLSWTIWTITLTINYISLSDSYYRDICKSIIDIMTHP